MYAVIKTGGKQYRVSAGSLVKVELLAQAVGEKVEFSEVLMIGDGDAVEVGKPTLTGRSVQGTVVAQERTRKVVIVKMRRRKHSMKRGTHRQSYTAVKIDGIA